jgi:AraC-like DNA-binding protein
MENSPDPDRLRRQLLDRLRPLATLPGRPRKDPGMHVLGRQVFTYCCFKAERIAQVTVARPLIGIVLSGAKEFWLGDAGQRFIAGDVFVLPGGATLDAVNIPDERHGLYESLLVEVASLPPSIARMPHLPPVRRPMDSNKGFDVHVTLTGDLVDALAHAATTLATSDNAAILGEHRLAEVLMLLRDDAAARPLFDVSLGDRIRWMVAADPSHRWTADELASRLAMGASTLRRRLTENGTPLRTVLAAARMQVAQGLLSSGGANVTAAAEAAGYTSRSHFNRRFRSVYGSTPGEHRARRAG